MLWQHAVQARRCQEPLPEARGARRWRKGGPPLLAPSAEGTSCSSGSGGGDDDDGDGGDGFCSRTPCASTAGARRGLPRHEPWLPPPLACCVLLYVFAVALGVARNAGSKFVRLEAQPGCASSWKDVGRPVLGELTCCPGGDRGEAAAAAAAAAMGSRAAAPVSLPRARKPSAAQAAVCATDHRAEAALATLAGAWGLPLLPLGLTAASAALGSLASRGSRHRAATGPPRATAGTAGTAGAGTAGADSAWASRPVRRLGCYLGLMLLRTVVLYGLLNSLEVALAGRLSAADRDAAEAGAAGAGAGGAALQPPCDFAALRRSGQCAQAWDGADHVVLLLCHHAAVCGSELAVALFLLRRHLGSGSRNDDDDGDDGDDSHGDVEGEPLIAAPGSPRAVNRAARSKSGGTGGTGGGGGSSGGSVLPGAPSTTTERCAALAAAGSALAAVALAVGVVLSTSRCALQTAALFHKPSESLAALAVGLVGLGAWRAAVVSSGQV